MPFTTSVILLKIFSDDACEFFDTIHLKSIIGFFVFASECGHMIKKIDDKCVALVNYYDK